MLTLTLSNLADQTDANVSTFTETITVNITDNDALGTGNYTQDANGRTEQSGASSTFSGTSNGEAVEISLNDRTLFSDLVGYTDAHADGSFTIHAAGTAATASTAYTKPAASNDDEAGGDTTATRGFSIDGNVLTLDAGADPGTYTVQASYTVLDGNLFIQEISYTTTAAAHPGTDTVEQVTKDQ